MDIIGINRTGEQITPLYNKLYSFEVGTQSENSEILEGIFTVMKHVCKQLTWVIDRGGDRTKLIVPLLRKRLKFIIRSLSGRKFIMPALFLSCLSISTPDYHFQMNCGWLF